MSHKIRFCYNYFMYEAKPGKPKKMIRGPARFNLFSRVVIRSR